MNLIRKFFQTKKDIQKYIEENGMESAIKEIGVKKLCYFKLLSLYEGTELYYDENAVVDKVYDKNGAYLGEITHLLSSFYKKLGYFYGPCQNGNIILQTIDKESSIRTYAIFDKYGKNLIPYGRYFNYCFMQNGVALMGKEKKSEHNAIIVDISGVIENSPYTYIEKTDSENLYQVYEKEMFE